MELDAVIVLIAPEDAWSRQLGDYLTMRNIEVIWRPDPLAGIETAQQWPPDVVVVDENTKVLRPTEIGKILKSKLPYTSLVLIGSAPTPLAMECLEAADYDLLVRRSDELTFIASQLRALCRSHDTIEHLVTSNRRLVRLSTTDSMTGLLNHKRLLDWLEIEFKRHERSVEPLSCIMIDIDHFKLVNDTYGHKFGDFVLQEFATLLRANVRKIDILGRYGGEEFLAILPNTEAVGAVNLGEKLRRAVEDFRIDQDGHTIRITASFGVASTSDGQVFNHDQLLQMTDKALYVAKQSGRNRVCSLTEIAPGGELAVEPLPKARAAERAEPTATILVESDKPPHETLVRLIERSGFRPSWVANVPQLFARPAQDQADVVIVDPGVTPANRERVCELLRDSADVSYPSVLMIVPQENEETAALCQSMGASGEVIATDDLEQVLGPVLRALYRLKILRDEVRDGQARLRTLQKKMLRSEKMKALGEIASGVAHDFNNALAVILGRSQVLRERATDNETRKGLILIERAARDVSVSVRRILDFFRPETKGKFASHFLDNLIQECLEVTKVRWKEEAHLKGIRYEITTRVPRGLLVWGNDTELAEVFNNVIFNALDAMPEGGKLNIAAEVEDEWMALEFTDTGVGMPREVLEKIYDPFFTTKSDKGTGLGLSVVRGIVLRHRGEIEVGSEPGQGTTVRIRLPIHHEEEAPQKFVAKRVLTPAGEKAAGEAAAMRVLVVDDEPDVRNLFADILASRGYDVMCAENGANALREIAQNEFQVIIVDLSMPQMSGWDVIAEARKISPHAKYVVTTGWGDSFVDVDLKARGVDHVLPKPVEVQSLADLMEHIHGTLEATPAKTAEAGSPS